MSEEWMWQIFMIPFSIFCGCGLGSFMRPFRWGVFLYMIFLWLLIGIIHQLVLNF